MNYPKIKTPSNVPYPSSFNGPAGSVLKKRHQEAVAKKDFFSTIRGSHAFHPLEDPFIETHFLDWVTDNIFDDERDKVVLCVSNLLAEDPDLVRDRSWSEIVRLADC